MDTTFITEAFSNMGYNVIEVKEIFHKTDGYVEWEFWNFDIMALHIVLST